MRLHKLDYLRGLAAVGIMLFHYFTWTFGQFEADSFMGRLGLYGVSIFYVLSGLTLHHVYYNKMSPSQADLRDFYVKRFFRIYPLMWAVIIGTIVVFRKIPPVSEIVLNVTGLFGFVKWDAYIGTGLWSIGNELVFYVFFPFFIYFSKHRPLLFWILSGALLGIYLYFGFVLLTPANSLTDQWHDYINPLNQVFLFLGGYMIGHWMSDFKLSSLAATLFILGGLAIFIFYPAAGDRIVLVTGVNRIMFTLACFFICFGVYKLRVEFPSFVDKPLALFGESSYSIYLLHPLVYYGFYFVLRPTVFKIFGREAPEVWESVKMPVLMGGSIVMTLVLSYFSYEKFEKFFMKKARAFQSHTA